MIAEGRFGFASGPLLCEAARSGARSRRSPGWPCVNESAGMLEVPLLRRSSADCGTASRRTLLLRSAARKIVALRADVEMQTRVDELVDKVNHGQLTDKKRAEYDSCLAAFHFVTILQARARRLLDQSAA